MKNSKYYGSAMALALAASIGAGAANAEQVNVGVIDSLTGAAAFGGAADVCGVRVAVDALRDAGLLGERTINLMVEDDQSKPAVAAQAASRLTAEGVKFFVGGAFSSTILAVLPIVKDAGALHTGGTSKADQLFEAGALVVRLNSDNAQDGASIAKYVSQDLKAKKIAFVALHGAYGEGALASIKASLAEGSEISDVYTAPAETTNFQSIITSIAADEPDAVIWAMFGNAQTVAFMRQYKQAGLKATQIAAAGNLTASQTKLAAGAADGVISADLWTAQVENPANAVLREAFAKYGPHYGECADKPLDKQVAISYSQMYLLASAIAKADSDDPETVRSTILSNEWELPQGHVKFNDKGQAIVQYYMIIGKGDDVVPLQ